jgi:CubicO group peptidase (beta-lactamase class C family)
MLFVCQSPTEFSTMVGMAYHQAYICVLQKMNRMIRNQMIPLLGFLIIASCGANPSGPGKKSAAVTAPPAHFSTLSAREKEYYSNQITPLYQSLLLKRGFSGGILLAKNGEIVFEDYHGLINQKTKEPVSANSTFHIASVSKTFTAAVILKLMEQGKLNLDDRVEKYLPDFPYNGITIRHLLTHRSGLPKYDHFMQDTRTEVVLVKNKKGKMVKRYRVVKAPVLVTGLPSNRDVLTFMIRHRPSIQALPDRRYSYCNTNYAMLALIVEQITGQAFPDYMRKNVFAPLGMTNSFVFSIRDTGRYIPSYNYNNSPFRLEKLDCIYGDKNVYSTVRDLLQWDKALYSGAFLSPATLEMAYQPYSHETRGFKNYGLGWHLYLKPSEPPVVYHNGWWHGNNAVFKRLIQDTATVIILGNKFNKNIYAAGKMSSVFTGRPDTTRLEE